MFHQAADSVTVAFGRSPKLSLVLSFLSDISGSNYYGVVYRSIFREPLFYARCSGDNPPHLKYCSNFDVPDLFIGESSFKIVEEDIPLLVEWLKRDRNDCRAKSQDFKPLGLVSICQGFA